MRRPRDVLAHQIIDELLGHEPETVVDPELWVVLGHQARADVIPVTVEPADTSRTSSGMPVHSMCAMQWPE